MLLNDFRIIGRELFSSGLNDSHSGNMSVRLGNRLVITRSGARLHDLMNADLIDLPLNSEERGQGSMETCVHREIYRYNGCKAIVHAHPVHLVALSFHDDYFRPIDSEGRFYFGNQVPILEVENAVSSPEVAAALPKLLKSSTAAIVRGHGVFSCGRTLMEAYKWISSLENSAKIACLADQYGKSYSLP